MADEHYTRDESEAESLDRQWLELLQELRIGTAGTQILFAFLLTIAFTQAFRQADDLTHRVYAVTLALAALATALLIGPVPFHRLLFRQRLRGRMVSIASKMANAGLFLLMLAMAGGVFMALDAALARSSAVVIVAGVLACFVLIWYVLPIVVRESSDGVRENLDK